MKDLFNILYKYYRILSVVLFSCAIVVYLYGFLIKQESLKEDLTNENLVEQTLGVKLPHYRLLSTYRKEPFQERFTNQHLIIEKELYFEESDFYDLIELIKATPNFNFNQKFVSTDSTKLWSEINPKSFNELLISLKRQKLIGIWTSNDHHFEFISLENQKIDSETLFNRNYFVKAVINYRRRTLRFIYQEL